MRVVLRTIVAIQVVGSETLKPSPIDSLGEQPEEFEEEPRRARARLGQPCNQGALMGISVSLVFIAVGAILKWAVTATVSGVDLGTVGVVRMIVGVVGEPRLSLPLPSEGLGAVPDSFRVPSAASCRSRSGAYVPRSSPRRVTSHRGTGIRQAWLCLFG